jgi:tRNA(Ile)-lysidine synthase
MPLIHDGDALLAVAGRWLSDAGKTLFEQAGSMPVWHRDD